MPDAYAANLDEDVEADRGALGLADLRREVEQMLDQEEARLQSRLAVLRALRDREPAPASAAAAEITGRLLSTTLADLFYAQV